MSDSHIERIERRERESRREQEIESQLYVLADTLVHSLDSLQSRTLRLLALCERECPHPVVGELAQLDFESGLADLLAWDEQMRASSYTELLGRIDFLGFETSESTDRGELVIDAVGWFKAEMNGFFGHDWPQPDLRTLNRVGEIVLEHMDTLDIPMAVNIVRLSWIQCYLCLLLGDFLSQSQFIVPACHKPLDVKLLIGNVLWFSLGRINDGQFERHPAPLSSASPDLD